MLDPAELEARKEAAAKEVIPPAFKEFSVPRVLFVLGLILEGGVDGKSEIETYAESMTEVSKFYHYFGAAVDYASGDLTGKRDSILENRDTLVKAGLVKVADEAYIYLEDMVNLEKAHGLAFMDGVNNSDILGKWKD